MDDLTKEMAAEVLGVPFVEDGPTPKGCAPSDENATCRVPQSFLNQALVPQSGRGMPNPNGTALRRAVREGRQDRDLPARPAERIHPDDGQPSSPTCAKRRRRSQDPVPGAADRRGWERALVEERVRDLMLGDNPTVAPYAKTGEVHLRVTARAGRNPKRTP